MTRSRSFWFAASLLASAIPVAGAEVTRKAIDITLAEDGSTRERLSLAVRIDTARDLDAWSPYALPLGPDGTLRHLEAWVEGPDGKRRDVPGRDLDWSDLADPTVLHASARARLIRFPEAGAGSVLRIESEIETHPYFPGGRLLLGEGTAVHDLDVRVHGNPRLRFAVSGDASTLEHEAAPGSLRLHGALPRPGTRERAPAAWEHGPILDYAWDGPSTWIGVGQWFEDLLRPVLRNDDAVRAQARSLIGTVQEPVKRLEILLRFVRESVRYVAVEVGVGGFRPQPAGTVLAQRWGDCKGKALLLIDLLREAGVRAVPVLLSAEESASPDAAFPTPFVFNHMIVGVLGLDPSSLGSNAPIDDGVLFVDPTLEEGGIGWLHPGTQGQRALLADGAASRLVTTPLLPSTRATRIEVDATVQETGDAQGTVTLELTGEEAAFFGHHLATTKPEDLMRQGVRLVEALLPGARAGNVQWSRSDDDLPRVQWSANVSFSGLATAQTGARAALLRGTGLLPSTELLEGRRAPVVLGSATETARWRLHLPAGWCAPPEETTATRNAVGRFTQTATHLPDGFALERVAEVTLREARVEDFAAVRELSLAEHRAARRRVRLDCTP